MSHDRHSRLSSRLGRLAEERIFLKEGFWTDPRRSEDKSQDDYMKARASVITISPGKTINGKSRNRRHAYAYDSI